MHEREPDVVVVVELESESLVVEFVVVALPLQYVVRCSDIFLGMSRSSREPAASWSHLFRESWMVLRTFSMRPMTAFSMSSSLSPISSMILSASASAAVATAPAADSTAEAAPEAKVSTELAASLAFPATSLTIDPRPRLVLVASVELSTRVITGGLKRAKLLMSICHGVSKEA